MKEESLCFGQTFKLPFESESGIIARIIHVNPSRRLQHLVEYCDNNPSGFHGYYSTKAKPGDVTLLNAYYASFPLDYPAGEHIKNCIKEAVHHRNCPKCALSGYHSNLFNFLCVTHCPIHNESITKHCPECHKCWQYGVKQYSTGCTTCGRCASYDDFLQMRTELSQQDFGPLINWYKSRKVFIAKDTIHSLSGFQSRIISRSENLLDIGNIVTHKSGRNYCRLDSRLKKNLIVQPEIKYWSLEHADLKKYLKDDVIKSRLKTDKLRGLLYQLPQHLKNAKVRACQELLLYGRNFHFFEEKEGIIDLDLTNEIKDYSIHVALAYWLVLSTMPKSIKLMTRDNTIPFLFRKGKLLPEPIYPREFVVLNSKTYKLSEKAQSYLYEKELIQLGHYILTLVKFLQLGTTTIFEKTDLHQKLKDSYMRFPYFAFVQKHSNTIATIFDARIKTNIELELIDNQENLEEMGLYECMGVIYHPTAKSSGVYNEFVELNNFLNNQR